MKNTIKKMIAMIMAATMSCFMIAPVFLGHAGAVEEPEQEEIMEEVYVLETVNVEESLNGLDLEAQVVSLTNAKTAAHELAENARKLGFAEDHEIIQAAKTVWNDANELWKVKSAELAKQKALEEQKRKQEEESRRISLGTFKLTAYCPCSQCCGQWANGITATGVTARANHTIAVDPRVIPYGSTVYIEGLGTFVAEDCGGAIKGNRIDVFYNTHSEALNSGVTELNPTVYLIK
jgi:3D (Asp-Asp-Asp) domain-containing protein